MARIPRLSVYHTIRQVPLVPVFYHPDAEVCAGVLSACYRAGVRAFEFTNRGDFAHERFADLSRLCARDFPDMALGAGTILDGSTAALYLQLGADFVVGPNFSEEVARVCNRRKVAYMPGCATLTEITTAHEWGVEFVKIFPGDVLGPEFHQKPERTAAVCQGDGYREAWSPPAKALVSGSAPERSPSGWDHSFSRKMC